MGRGTPLTEFEKGQITALSLTGQSARAIARALGRSHAVIDNYLKLGERYGKKKSTGRPQKLTTRQKRSIVKEIATTSVSSRQLAKRSEYNVSKTTILRTISQSKCLVYKKRRAQPALKPQHKTKRILWAKQHMSWTELWKQVLFSDEKKFNLDGPDGCQYYWHDLRREDQLFSKRQQGGGSLMVWAAFGWSGQTNIAFLNGRMKATDYHTLLDEYLMPFGEMIGGSYWQFQQDNAPIHTARSTYEWFLNNGVQVMDWPALSPDLNPIENVWGVLARKVYEGGKQYTNVADLKAAIICAWENIDEDYRRKLVLSMANRVFKVIQKNGGFIGY